MRAQAQRSSLLRMDLPQAVLIAILLHLLFLGAARVYPGLLAPFTFEVPEPGPTPEPLTFSFVDLPEEPPEPETPPENAPASDRTRRVSSPAPPEPVPESPDPFSQGNTAQKVAFAPGEDANSPPSPAQEPVEPQPRVEPSQEVPEVPPEEEATPEPEPEEQAPPDEPQPDEQAADEPPLEESTQGIQPPPERPETSNPAQDEALKAQAVRDAMRPANMRVLGQRFDNLSAPAQQDFGQISFDTVGVDWGPYAKLITQLIREKWIERIPPAAKMGLAGRSVISFRIAKDGVVTAIVLLDGSGTRPLDKAAEFAIEAASPLPPLPDEFHDTGKDDVGVTFEFYYNMRPPPR